MTSPFDPKRITWAVLLGRWTDFARSALALPDDDTGNALRQSVPDIIMLQAIWFSLHHLDELDADQRALGLDRAEVLIDKHAAALEARWQNQSMPEQFAELLADARGKLREVAGDDNAHD